MRPIIKSVCAESRDEAVQEEVIETLKLHKNEERKEKFSNNQLMAFDIPLTIGYNMGWNKRSLGHMYNSISGCGVIVGGHTKKSKLQINIKVLLIL